MFQRREETANAVFHIVSAEEIPFGEASGGPVLTKGRFVFSYRGDLEGEGILEELKVHFTSKRASIYGLQRFTGRLGELTGSFVLKHEGQFANGSVNVKLTVVPGSGTDGLKGLRAEIILKARPSAEFPISFKYHFA